MKTAKDLIIPFSWANRRPHFQEQFLYVPINYEYRTEKFPFFESNLPIFIEYCSGNGQWILEKAKQNPQVNWLAVEKKFQRAKAIWKAAQKNQIKNLCVVCSDGLAFTQFYAPKASRVFINFPDPWPKRKHAKHRIISLEFLDELEGILEDGAILSCVTDDPGYAKQILDIFEQHASYSLMEKEVNVEGYGESFFKSLWEQQGRTIHFLTFEKVCSSIVELTLI